MSFIVHDQQISGGAIMDVSPNYEKFTVEIPLIGECSITTDKWQNVVGPKKVMHISSPSLPSLFADSGCHYQAISVQFEQDLIKQSLGNLLGRDVDGDVTFYPFLSGMQSGADTFRKAVVELLRSFDRREAPAINPKSLVLYEEFLASSLLLIAKNSHSASLRCDQSAASSKNVATAVDYIEEHFDEPINVGDIARAVGVSIRSLQRAFLRSHGISPMTYLKNIRMQQVRSLLIAGDQNSTVTKIAMDCGFNHLGAFSVEYKKMFGEAPSETLRR